MLSCILGRWLGCMECPYPLSLIVVPNSFLNFESLSKKVLVAGLSLVQPFILKLIGKWSVLFKHQKIFLELAWLTLRVIGMIISLWLGLLCEGKPSLQLSCNDPPSHFYIYAFCSLFREFLYWPQFIYDWLGLIVWSPSRLFGFCASF